MAKRLVVGTDGSDSALEAAIAALELVAEPIELVVATVVPGEDPMLVTGTGFAAGVASPEELSEATAEAVRRGQEVVARTIERLGRAQAEGLVLRGDPGVALCELAEESRAAAIVVGSRGLGPIRRALLGSVSHYVVQHAPCPVIVAGAGGDRHGGTADDAD